LLGLLKTSEQYADTPFGSKSSPGLLSTLQIFQRAKLFSDLQIFVAEYPEKMREVLTLYDRAYPVGTAGYYPILQHEICFNMGRFLMEAGKSTLQISFTNGPTILTWVPNESRNTAAELVRISTNPALTTPVISASSTETAPVQVGASRYDVLTWLMRAYHSGLDYLTLKDQVWSLSNIALMFKQLGFVRKHSFFMRLVGISSESLRVKEDYKKQLLSLQCMELSLAELTKLKPGI
jgi:hypothetical protein